MSSSVLIVEDEFFVALEMETILEEAGFTSIGIAADAQSALRIAAETPPEIAFVDVNLKDGPTGPLIAKRLRDLYDSTIIFVTANPRMIEAPAGAIGFMEKPYDDESLTNVASYADGLRAGKPMKAPQRFVAYA